MTSLPSTKDLQIFDITMSNSVGDDDKAQFKSLSQSRRGLRISVTKSITGLANNLQDLATAIAIRDKLAKLSKDLIKLDKDILDLLQSNNLGDDDYLAEVENAEKYQDALGIAVQRAELEIASLKAARAASQQTAGGTNTGTGHQQTSHFNPTMSLPKLALPTFDSDPLNYARFISQFESVIDKTPYSDPQKFLLLEQSLTGEAKAVVRTPGMRCMTYAAARKALDDAYKDSYTLQFSIIEHLINLKMDTKTPYYWYAEVNSLKEQTGLHAMDADSFIHYFAWHSLPQSFREQLVSITKNTRPSLKEILDNFYKVSHRIRDIAATKGATSSEKTLSMPTTSSVEKQKASGPRPKSCPYCSSADHVHSKCPKYTTPSARVQRLKKLNRCERCTSDHVTSSCNFRFKFKCAKCKAEHFSSLCSAAKPASTQANAVVSGGDPSSPDPQQSAASDPGASSHATVSSGVTVSCASSANAANIILPSFTARLESTSGAKVEVRGWKDSCSQNTLIDEKLANELSLETIENVALTLKGFNSFQSFNSRKVKLPIWIKNSRKEIIAIVVPSIDISLELSGLDRVVGEFSGRGLPLADKDLGGSHLSGGRLLLGSEHAWVLPVKTVPFGHSSYLDSPIGIMLEGDLRKMIKDFQHLKTGTPDEGSQA